MNPLVVQARRLAGPVRRGAQVALNAGMPILVGLFLVGLVDEGAAAAPVPVRVLGMIAGFGQGIALYWRHSNPRTVAAITVVGGLITQLIAPVGLFPYAGMIVMWSLTTTHPPRSSLPVLAGLVGVTTLSWGAVLREDTLFAIAVVVVVWALAEATRSRRVAITQASRQAAEREQARLARELHDVIAHSVSVIVVQAAAGDDVFDHHPAAAREALRSIESAGREALAELRRLLAAIGPPDPAEERRPQPALDRLDELAEPLRSVGLVVGIRRVDDGTIAVPAGVQLSAYRIVQEALTNVLRHAKASTIEVRIEATGSLLEVSVTDDGTGVSRLSGSESFGSGRGIAGMRQRASLLGGTLDAEPRPEGGFRVWARLPLQPSR
jgi:signal transduction histidine kinase